MPLQDGVLRSSRDTLIALMRCENTSRSRPPPPARSTLSFIETTHNVLAAVCGSPRQVVNRSESIHLTQEGPLKLLDRQNAPPAASRLQIRIRPNAQCLAQNSSTIAALSMRYWNCRLNRTPTKIPALAQFRLVLPRAHQQARRKAPSSQSFNA